MTLNDCCYSYRLEFVEFPAFKAAILQNPVFGVTLPVGPGWRMASRSLLLCLQVSRWESLGWMEENHRSILLEY